MARERDVDAWELVGTAMLIPARFAAQGWAVMTLWGWFVASLGIAVIGFWEAIGISLIVSLLNYRARLRDERALGVILADARYRMMGAMWTALLCVGLGWIAHRFMR